MASQSGSGSPHSVQTALLLARWMIGAVLAAALGGCSTAIFDFDSTGSISSQQVSAEPSALNGRVFVLRGMMGKVFSTGMDDLSAELNSRGLRATVHDREWEPVADLAIAEYKAAHGKMRIMLAGHSDGADSIIAMSYRLQDAGIPVALAVTFDPTRVLQKPVPANVERFINLYQSNNLLGGGSSHRAASFHGHFVNVNLRERDGLGHITIDKSRLLHEAIIPKFLQVAAFGAVPNDNPVPISYVIPKDAKVEIWDSGIAVQVSPGDTIETLAARYGVPAWSIRSVNTLADDARISPGQNLVIPRYISAPAAVAQQIGGPALETLALTQAQPPQR